MDNERRSHMMPPNIFRFATSELSQDAMLAYWLQWAHPHPEFTQDRRHALGVALLRRILEEAKPEALLDALPDVEVGRQLESIDVWAKVGSEYFLIIEDKTDTREHSNQLARYREQARKLVDSSTRVVVTYVKTGNESRSYLPKDESIVILRRSDLINLLEGSPTGDEVFEQFAAWLRELEDRAQAFSTASPVDWSNDPKVAQIEGFYMALEDHLDKEGSFDREYDGWSYVSNPAGGFHALFCGWKQDARAGCWIYLQIENGHRLQVRAGDSEDGERVDTETRYAILERLEAAANSPDFPGLSIEKSGRYRPGRYVAVADVLFEGSSIFPATTANGILALGPTKDRLKQAMALLDRVVRGAD